MIDRLRRLCEPRTKEEARLLVASFTVIAVVVALTITYVTNRLTATPMGPSMIPAVVIPLLLAPWMVGVVARFTVRLEEMRQELERLAHTDPLSGALNRRGLAAFVERALVDHADKEMTAIVLDVDRFKEINDTHGHAAGDAVIARVAEITRAMLPGDHCAVGRLGGDELVAIALDCTLEETLHLAERLRDAIEQMGFFFEGRQLAITTSIGVVTGIAREMAVGDMAAQALLHRADRALYAAKSDGRNRVRAAA